MSKNRLFIRTRAAAAQSGGALPLFEKAILSHPYFPARGVPYSLLIHAIVLTILVFLRVSHNPADQLQIAARPVVIDNKEPRVVMYLPLIGGGHQGQGSEGRGHPGGGLPARRKGPAAASAPGKKGLSYPGPQRILSDFPKPTNLSQTLLQPALVNPPILPPPLSLPNIVQMTDAAPAPKPKPPEPPKPVEPPPVEAKAKPPEPVPVATLAMPEPVDQSKMVQPASIPKVPLPEIKYPEPTPSIKPPEQVAETPAPKEEKRELPPEPPPKPPEPMKIEAPSKVIDEPTAPSGRELSPLPTRGNDLHNLLALSPMPTLHDQPFEVPVGEAHGRFAISPDANLDTKETEPGPQVETSPLAVGMGNHTPSPAGNGTSEGGGGSAASGTGTGTGSGSGGGTGSGVGSGPGAGPGPGVGAGSGPGTGSGPGSIAGSGSGKGPGTGSGTGVGTGTGTGSGAGSGPGKGPFAGISIIGGVSDTGAAGTKPAPRAQPRRPLQTAYGITIISTENSGGGLPPFGVFSREQVYTVYLDMRQTEMDSTPSWTLEFAVPQGPPGQTGTDGGPSQQGLVLPFPVDKNPPVLPAELVRKYIRRMMIVYGIVNIEGKLEQISVKESPDVLLNDPVVSALSKWTFRPARLHGEPVPAKLLIGIPLWLPQ